MSIVNRSEFTVRQAKKASTWDEYEANRAARTANLRAKDPRIKSNKQVQLNEETNRYETVNQTNETRFVEAVAKLTTAVDRLCDEPEYAVGGIKEVKEIISSKYVDDYTKSLKIKDLEKKLEKETLLGVEILVLQGLPPNTAYLVQRKTLLSF